MSGARHALAFLQIALIPLLLEIALFVTASAFPPKQLVPGLAALIWGATRSVSWTLLILPWLRYLLLSQRYSSSLWRPRWDRVHSRCALHVVFGIILPGTAISQSLSYVSHQWPALYHTYFQYLFMASTVANVLVYAGAGLAFCALVVGDGKGLLRNMAWSWRRSPKATVAMTTVLAPTVWIVYQISNAAGAFLRTVPSAWILEIDPAVVPRAAGVILNIGIIAAVWSFAFRRLTGWRGPQQEILERFD